MNTLALQTITYFVAFIAIWFGAGLIVSSVSTLARSWKLPAFIVSFFLLGILTSLPEIAIGTMSLIQNDPSISVGNLLGGAILLFLCVIPLLGILGNGVSIPSSINTKQLLLILVSVLAPALLTSDQVLTQTEGSLLLILYLILFIFMFQHNGFAEKIAGLLKRKNKHWGIHLVKIVAGILILWVASQHIVTSTILFANLFRVPPFFISLIIVSIGTNIPEISIVFRSLFQRRTDIALADFLGSAVANTPILGALSIIYGKDIIIPNHFFHRFIFMGIGLVLFFIFARSNKRLTRNESFAILLCYIAFLGIEIATVFVGFGLE